MKFNLHRSVVFAALVMMGGACSSKPERAQPGLSGGAGSGSGGSATGGSSAGGGNGGAGGTTETGGTTNTGGQAGSGGSGGAVSTGGTTTSSSRGGSGGASVSGGATGSGGGAVMGGRTGSGGSNAPGGTTSAGGQSGQGGTSATGGGPSTAGRSGSGGATGGTAGRGGSGGPPGTGGGTPGTGGSTGSGGTSAPPSTGSAPCDIFKAAGNDCAAAHSTVRALFSSYSGKLYQIRKGSTTQDISTLSAGGFADGASHESFCSGATCELLIIYDQTGKGNDIYWQASDSPKAAGKDKAANASKEKLSVGGHSVYSVYMDPGNAYWIDGSKNGMPLGKDAEGIYMVTSGTHMNGSCCFDYGQGETSRSVGSCGSMDGLYFGSECWFGGCSGSGPWVEHDPECGIYPGGSQSWPSTQKAFPQKYVTAMLKNNGTTLALKGADATTGSLTTVYSGKPAFTPNKQGAIMLGSGGDCCYSNTNMSQGTFYEGAIVKGYPSDATDDAIQANIVATKYGAAAMVTSYETDTETSSP